MSGGDGTREDLVRLITQRFSACATALTDSGTSALVLALRMTAGPGGIVAFPAYVCVDLIAAARKAEVKVRLYDVDPHTLSPDLTSLRLTLDDGVQAVVVAHLYGFPADMPGVRALVQDYGVPLIEDAAQQAGATLYGIPAGGMGDISILSFGRGKGTTAGNGGALLALTERWQPIVEALTHALPAPARGNGDMIGATASWIMGRPSLYDIPASLPMLKLGETVYHEAQEPAAMSHAGATLLRSTIEHADAYTAIRRRHAERLTEAANASARLHACQVIDNGVGGYLRFPIVTGNPILPSERLGIIRGYPRPLFDYEEIQPILLASNQLFRGARCLARGLLTLPTHHLLNDNDVKQLTSWLRMA